MAVLKLIDTQLYADNGDGSYSEVKLRDLKSATLECKCNDADREKLKQILLGENHYRENPRIDIPSKENICDQINRLLVLHHQDLSEFEVSVMTYNDPVYNHMKLTILLANYAYQTKNGVTMIFFDSSTPEEIQAVIGENLNALVMRYLADIKTRNKIFIKNIKKENDIMAQYTCGKIEVTKTQEEIELEEKLAKLRAEYDKKAAKLREEYKAVKEKRLNDQHSKEIHDKYQSLIDAGFTEEKAWEILKTMLGEFEL